MSPAIGKTLMQLATVLFFLNTASAYGECCIVPSDTESGVEMPCHTDDDVVVEVPADDCCLTCLVVLQLDNGPSPMVVAHQTSLIANSALPATASFDPPFRPPIHTLS